MLKTFPKGGIHPAENKITSFKAIKKMQVPKVVYVPIAQHIGIPSEIVVDRKDKVKIGQVIAKSSGSSTSLCHACGSNPTWLRFPSWAPMLPNNMLRTRA